MPFCQSACAIRKAADQEMDRSHIEENQTTSSQWDFQREVPLLLLWHLAFHPSWYWQVVGCIRNNVAPSKHPWWQHRWPDCRDRKGLQIVLQRAPHRSHHQKSRYFYVWWAGQCWKERGMEQSSGHQQFHAIFGGLLRSAEWFDSGWWASQDFCFLSAWYWLMLNGLLVNWMAKYIC